MRNREANGGGKQGVLELPRTRVAPMIRKEVR